MKKIGLAVCYDTHNYGSQLQVLATVKILEKHGFNTEIIRYKKRITPGFIAQTIPRLFNISFIRAKLNLIKKRNHQKRSKFYDKICIREKRFDMFVDTYLTNLSQVYEGWETLVKETADNYDVFLCGSDQLWLPNNLGSHFYTLEFAPDNKPKIAYATSFGVSQIPDRQKKATAKYLNRFQYLSTRELSGQAIIKDLTQKDVPVVCDPTLLFDSEGWKNLIPYKKIIQEPYVFCFLLGNNGNHRKISRDLANKLGIKIVTCPFMESYIDGDETFGDIQMFDIDAGDFINLIRHAEYVLTDSFHGSVFSILNHKKFLVFDRFTAGVNSRNSRIDSLCSLLNLTDRRFNGDSMRIMDDINYESVDKKLEKFRENSISYLVEALK